MGDDLARRQFAHWLRQLPRPPRRLMALTGAGISAESGIPTFRGRDRLWRGMDPTRVFSPEILTQDPLLAWQLYDELRLRVAETAPNPGHVALAVLARCRALTLVTQNIDGLHQRAGSDEVLELHGSLWRLRCAACVFAEMNTHVPLPVLPPRCPRCAAVLRPDIVLYTEALPADVLHAAVAAAEQCDVLLVVGTSGVVYPAAALPGMARAQGAAVVEINPDDTALTPGMDHVIRAPAAAALSWVTAELLRA